MANTEMQVKDKDIGEDELPQKSDKSAHIRANRNLYKVLPMRLPADKWELIRKEANDFGIGPSTLARIWILDCLRKLGNDTEKPEEADKKRKIANRVESSK